MTLRSLGDAHNGLAEYAVTREYYEAALPLYRKYGYRLGEANAILGLGNMARGVGDYSLARSLYDQSLRIRREIADRAGEAQTFVEMGDLWAKQGDVAQAISSYQTAAQLFDQIGPARSVKECHGKVAQLQPAEKPSLPT